MRCWAGYGFDSGEHPHQATCSRRNRDCSDCDRVYAVFVVIRFIGRCAKTTIRAAPPRHRREFSSDELVQPRTSVTPQGCCNARLPCARVAALASAARPASSTRPRRRVGRAASGVVHRRHRLHSQVLLQRLDPGSRPSHIAIVHCRAFVRNIPVLVGMYVAALLLALASKIPVAYFNQRVWLFIPIFTGIVVCPRRSASSPTAHRWCRLDIGSVTASDHRQGLRSAALIVVTVATSISSSCSSRLDNDMDTPACRARRCLCHECSSWCSAWLSIRLPSAWFGHRQYESRKAPPCRPTTWCGRSSIRSATAGTMFGKAHAIRRGVPGHVSRGYTGQARSLSAFKVDQSICMGGRLRDRHRAGPRVDPCHRSLNRSSLWKVCVHISIALRPSPTSRSLWTWREARAARGQRLRQVGLCSDPHGLIFAEAGTLTAFGDER